MPRTNLPPLEYDANGWGFDNLLPGHIVAHSAFRFGEPIIAGTRMPTDIAGASWRAKCWEDYALTEQQTLIAAAFEAGRAWQRSHKRRRRIEAEVKIGWERYEQTKKEATQ